VKEDLEPLERRTQSGRRAVSFSPASLAHLNRDRSAWYETPEEIEAGLEWGRRKAELLRWVRRQMGRRLTLRERRCIELYFFRDKNYREVAKATGTGPSSAYRATARAIRKLRRAAATDKALERINKAPQR